MKTTFPILLLCVGLGVAATTQAQDNQKEIPNAAASPKTTIRVRVSEDKDGKTETTERSYQFSGLSDDQREAKVKAIIDSLQTKSAGMSNRRLSVVVEEGDGQSIETRSDDGREMSIVSPNQKVQIYQFDDRSDDQHRASADRMKRIEKDMKLRSEKADSQAKTWGQQFKYDFNDAFRGSIFDVPSNRPASVRNLNAYPNNPDKNELNLRFYAPTKGDIYIIVTDTKGRQVAKKEIKDFSGEYVGQVDLGKNTKGTYFVTVTQNEDGAVKRIVIE